MCVLVCAHTCTSKEAQYVLSNDKVVVTDFPIPPPCPPARKKTLGSVPSIFIGVEQGFLKKVASEPGLEGGQGF